MIGYGRGGGGGSSSFPYRSAHQQGQDGGQRGRRGGNQKRKKTKARTPKNTISIAAELDIPPNQRRLIVGRGAATLKWMKIVTGANIFVPHVQVQNRRGRRSNDNNQAPDSDEEQADQHPVRVNSPDLSSVLHAFYEISNLLSRSQGIDITFIPCIVRMKSNNNIPTPPPLNGKIFIEEKSEDVTSKCRCLFTATLPCDDQSGTLRAYSIELSSTLFDEESIGMIVDNILFIDSSLEKCNWYYKEIDKKSADNSDDEDVQHESRRIVFIFGSNSDNIETFFEALKDGISAAEKSSQLVNENK